MGRKPRTDNDGHINIWMQKEIKFLCTLNIGMTGRSSVSAYLEHLIREDAKRILEETRQMCESEVLWRKARGEKMRGKLNGVPDALLVGSTRKAMGVHVRKPRKED